MLHLRLPRALRVLAPALLLPLLVLAHPAPTAEAGPAQMPGVQMVEAWPDVEFKEPVDVASPKDKSGLVFVVEQKGTIQALRKYRGAGAVPKPSLFLDIRSKVYARSQGGLLSLAFHPKYASNRLFYVSYTAKNASAGPGGLAFKLVIAEFRGNGTKADPRSERTLLEIPKANAQHQAGGIRFGPDGMLYIGVGDAKEPDAAQNPRSLYGKMLRIDPTTRSNGAYGIPTGNPWPKVRGVRPEIWGFGLRNPWRFGWDMQGRLITMEPGTTGPQSREWLMEVKYGGNHGWPYMEGTRRLKAPAKPKTFVPPSFEIVRGGGDGTAGVGGTVYRGDRIKGLRGKYVFGDYMRGEVYCIDLVTQGSGKNARVVGRNHRMLGECPEFAGLGTDAQGEMYFCANDLGLVFTLAPDA
ncbi:MAG: PQQ-dependent sugar dehydrogenase [Planctomycetota bacterium]|nr:PQQ-dependent sugar dehydrogenase [Planctomycetota bacterium]